MTLIENVVTVTPGDRYGQDNTIFLGEWEIHKKILLFLEEAQKICIKETIKTSLYRQYMLCHLLDKEINKQYENICTIKKRHQRRHHY